MMSSIISFGKLLADPTRLKIIKLLLTKPMCVCELIEIMRLNQARISQHLTILKYHHLLKARREGRWIVYEIDRKSLAKYLKEVRQFLKTPLTRLPDLKNEYRRFKGLEHRGLLCQKIKTR